MALASEVELDDEASAGSGSAKEDDRAEGDADDDAPPGGSGAGEKAADGDESSTGEEADEVSTSEDTEDEIEDKVSADTVLKPVAGKNAAATTSEPREASVTGGKVMALGAGALFLAAGVYLARRTFWS